MSVHGANRLGSNSLLEASVFGQRAGVAIAEFVQDGAQLYPLTGNPAERNRQRIREHLDSDGSELVDQIGEELKETMTQNCGVFRDETKLRQALSVILDLKRPLAFSANHGQESAF